MFNFEQKKPVWVVEKFRIAFNKSNVCVEFVNGQERLISRQTASKMIEEIRSSIGNDIPYILEAGDYKIVLFEEDKSKFAEGLETCLANNAEE